MIALAILSAIGVFLAGVSAFASLILSMRQRKLEAVFRAHLPRRLTVATTAGFKPGHEIVADSRRWVVDRVLTANSLEVHPASLDDAT